MVRADANSFETFGTVYGLAMAMSGAFGLVLTPLGTCNASDGLSVSSLMPC